MKKKTLNITIMTKRLAASLAKEVAFRGKKAPEGIAPWRGQAKDEKGK
jgi:hypothetical protein